MNIAFWNINDKRLDDLIRDLALFNQIDVLVFGESPYTSSEVLLILNKSKSDYYYVPNNICDKLQCFVKFDPTLITMIDETRRVSAWRIYSNRLGNINLIAVHYNSKVNWANEDQAAHSSTFKKFIDDIEVRTGHQRTIIFGDFNMNPFDFGMVQSTGLHSVMEKRIALKRKRTIDGYDYDFFYNPMWSFLGDEGKGSVSGTLYYSPAKPVSYHWNLFDQVLVRPDLIPEFDENNLDIVTQIGKTSLLTTNHLINTNYSDHLPLKFTVNL